jgi:UDP-glucose 4-epimerase
VRTTRAREVLGFTPRHTTEETLEAFVQARGAGLLPPGTLASAVDRVAALLPGNAGARATDGAGSQEEVRQHG